MALGNFERFAQLPHNQPSRLSLPRLGARRTTWIWPFVAQPHQPPALTPSSPRWPRWHALWQGWPISSELPPSHSSAAELRHGILGWPFIVETPTWYLPPTPSVFSMGSATILKGERSRMDTHLQGHLPPSPWKFPSFG